MGSLKVSVKARPNFDHHEMGSPLDELRAAVAVHRFWYG
jgi:hypothetical protein